MEVLLVTLEVVSEVRDPFRQQSHLHFRGPGIGLGFAIFLYNFSLAFRG
jgi:hypothetical protein